MAVGFEKARARLGARGGGRCPGASRHQEKHAKRLRDRGATGRVRGMNGGEPRSGEIPFWKPNSGALPGGLWFGMTTRSGGVSARPYDTLNLGLGVGDEEASVRENRRRLQLALGMSDQEPRLLHQVHGKRIVAPDQARGQADGFLVRAGDPWVAVSAADCAPVAVVSEDGAHATLLHSGWRGARERIAAHAVERLAAAGTAPGQLRGAIGPCLHACCFPIGPEVAREFPPAFLKPHQSGRKALDLPLAIATALIEAGVRPDRIEIAPDCTSCRRDSYFSHRRDRGLTGRHWALLRLGPPRPA
jgi:polyphenol oxidase